MYSTAFAIEHIHTMELHVDPEPRELSLCQSMPALSPTLPDSSVNTNALRGGGGREVVQETRTWTEVPAKCDNTDITVHMWHLHTLTCLGSQHTLVPQRHGL